MMCQQLFHYLHWVIVCLHGSLYCRGKRSLVIYCSSDIHIPSVNSDTSLVTSSSGVRESLFLLLTSR